MNKITQKYIEQHANLIEREDWVTFYKGLDLQLGSPMVSDLTRDFLDAGINPLEDLTEVPNAYLTGDQQITSVDLKGITSIGRKAFSGCSNLEEVSNLDSLQKIEAGAFQRCQKLKDLKLANGIQSIEEYAFSNTGWTSIELPDSIEYLGEACFNNCINLKKIKFSSKLGQIRESVCAGCESLEEIIIPEGVDKRIVETAFWGCFGLKDVYLPSTLVFTDLNRAFPMRSATFHINMTEEQFRKQGNQLALEEETQVKVTFLK